MRYRVSLASSSARPDRTWRFRYKSADIGLGIETCSMEERMQKEYQNRTISAISHATDNHGRKNIDRDRRINSENILSTNSARHVTNRSLPRRRRTEPISTRFSSRCLPVLSVQRNEEFNVITTQSQEFNRGRCARNMFSEKRIGSVQNIMVDEGMEEIQMRKKRFKVR